MLNSTIEIKVKQRLNKLDSQDYDNIQCWQIVEAFNKAQVEWVRRQLHGLNLVKEGDEQSNRRKDDLQVLLTTTQLTPNNKQFFYAAPLPADYLAWKRVDLTGGKDCCNDRRMMVYLTEESNVSELLRDKAKQPSFEWGETFATLSNNNVNVYTNGDFTIGGFSLIYYRQPRRVEFLNCSDPYTNAITAADVTCEFKDDIIELIIDDATAIIAGDIESTNQYGRNSQSSEKNN
jgi:hypothetical protein